MLRTCNKKPTMPPLLFLSDDQRIKNPLSIIASLPQNCGVILRDYSNPERNSFIKNAIKLSNKTNHLVFIATIKGAHGQNQHWPQAGRFSKAKRRRGQKITASAHNLSEIGRLNRLKVDGILLSPVFATKSHPRATPLNIHRFIRMVRLAKPIVYALGGMSARNVKNLRQTKVNIGMAGISIFMK